MEKYGKERKGADQNREERKRMKKNRTERTEYPNQLASLDNFVSVLYYQKQQANLVCIS